MVTQEHPDEAFAQVLLDEGREELQRADNKASILLAASGIVAASLLGGAISGDWDPTHVVDWRAENIFWTGIAIALVGIALLGGAVMPRTRHLGKREDLAYFGHVVLFRQRGLAFSKDERKERLDRAKEDLRSAVVTASAGRFDRTVDQVWTISMIVHKKYRRIRWALQLFGVAALVCTVALAVDARW